MPVSTRKSIGSTKLPGAQQSKLTFSSRITKPTESIGKSLKTEDVKARKQDTAVLVQSSTPPPKTEEVRVEDDVDEEDPTSIGAIEILKDNIPAVENKPQVLELEDPEVHDEEDETESYAESIVERPKALPTGVENKQEIAAVKVTDKQIKDYYKGIKESRIGSTVHQEHLNEYEKILRHFDLSSQYGPCVGLTRFKRWNRAQRLGLHPPIEVLAVLIRADFGEDLKTDVEDRKSASESQKDGVGAVAYINDLLATHAES